MSASTGRTSEPAAIPSRRLRHTTRDLTRELGGYWKELDPAVFAPRVAAVVFLAAGVLAFAAGALLPSVRDLAALRSIAAASAAFGAAALFAPWQRWGGRAQLALPMFAFALFAWGGILARGQFGAAIAMLPLPFVFVGFTQRPGTAALLTPAAAAALVAAARCSFDGALVSTLVFALPMSLLAGEAIAQAQARRTRAEQRVDRLLQAVRILARMPDERTGAEIVAALTAELLGAHAVAVLLADPPGARRYLNRAWFGHPALADAAPLLVDLLDGDRALRVGAARFVTDRERLRRLAGTRRAVRAAVLLPLPGGDGPVPAGVVIAMWGTTQRRLPAAARQAAELLGEEAGRMFQRLREAAALAHDAETDPLTDLANRRTFGRALATLQPGDALVVVDLDHFKKVNDRFGHQAGDDALRLLARCLRDTARQVDCVARYGGEEFAIVLPGAGASGACSMLERVREAWGTRRPVTTFSAGIAVHAVGRPPRDTLRRADAALYAAKEGGRDRDELALDDEIVLP